VTAQKQRAKLGSGLRVVREQLLPPGDAWHHIR